LTSPEKLIGELPEQKLGGHFRVRLLPEIPDRAVVAGRWGRRDRLVRRLYGFSDALALLLAMVVALFLAGHRSDQLEASLLFAATLPGWILLFKLYGLYDRTVKRISHSAVDDIPWLFHALLVGGLLFWGLCRLGPIEQMTLLESVLFGALAVLMVVTLRGLSTVVLLERLGPERVLVVGDGPVVEPLQRTLARHPEFGLEPIGILSDEAESGAAPGLPAGPLGRLGAIADLERVVSEQLPDRVFVCRAAFDVEQVLEVIDTCRRYSLKVGILPDALESFGPSVEIDEIHGIAVLGISPPVLSQTSRLVKRGFDLLVASAVLLLTAPVLIAAAVAVRASGPGPIIFRQSRVGRAGERFELLKFRTMVPDAEARREELMKQSSDERWLRLEHDPRVTRPGALLRRTSIDELPQLINVLRGEMSLVGPRPLPEAEDVNIGGWGRGRLDLTPGITGLWQVLGRTRIPFDEMVKLDYLYVTNWSLWLDIRLLLRTLPAVLSGRGVG
jgi:exopolysaccharide biosynthesis polyprenyl glycosylphosphotransferase